MRKTLFLLPLILLTTSCSPNVNDLSSLETNNLIEHNINNVVFDVVEIEYVDENVSHDFVFYHSSAKYNLARLFKQDYVSGEIDNKFLSKSSDFKKYVSVDFVRDREQGNINYSLEYYFYNSEFGVLRIDNDKCYKVDLTYRSNLYTELLDIEDLIVKNDSYYVFATTYSRMYGKVYEADVEFSNDKFVVEISPIYSYDVILVVPDIDFTLDLNSSFSIQKMPSSIYIHNNPHNYMYEHLGVKFSCFFLEDNLQESVKLVYKGNEIEIIFKIAEYDSSVFKFQKPTNEYLLDPSLSSVKNTIDSLTLYDKENSENNYSNSETYEYQYTFTDGYDTSYLSYLPSSLYYPSSFVSNPEHYYSEVSFVTKENQVEYLRLGSKPFNRIYWTGEIRPYLISIYFRAINKNRDDFYKDFNYYNFEFFFEYLHSKNNFLTYNMGGLDLYISVIYNSKDSKYLRNASIIFEDSNFYYIFDLNFLLEEGTIFL